MRIIAVFAAVSAMIWSIISWYEANKEIEILCSEIQRLSQDSEMNRLIQTAEYIRLPQYESREFLLRSRYNLFSSKCEVRESSVQGAYTATYSQSFELDKTAAWLAVFLFSLMAVFQICLSFGMPYGHLAWGGKHKVLPVGLRAGSMLVALIFIVGGFLLLVRVDIIHFPRLYKTSEIAAYFLLMLFSLSMIGNYMSRSEAERRVMLPVSILLGALCLIIVLSV